MRNVVTYGIVTVLALVIGMVLYQFLGYAQHNAQTNMASYARSAAIKLRSIRCGRFDTDGNMYIRCTGFRTQGCHGNECVLTRECSIFHESSCVDPEFHGTLRARGL